MLPFVGPAAEGEAVGSALRWELSLQGEPFYRFHSTPRCDPPLVKHAGEGGERGEMGECAGPVWGNSVASSLIQN